MNHATCYTILAACTIIVLCVFFDRPRPKSESLNIDLVTPGTDKRDYHVRYDLKEYQADLVKEIDGVTYCFITGRYRLEVTKGELFDFEKDGIDAAVRFVLDEGK
jgi:hypothetical protein